MLRLPKSVYAGIKLKKDGFKIACLINGKVRSEFVKKETDIIATALSYVSEYAEKHDVNFIAISIMGRGPKVRLGSKLWRKLDIVPIFPKEKMTLTKSIKYAKSFFDKYDSAPAKINLQNKVEVMPLVRLANYEAITPIEEFQELLKLSHKFKGKKLTFLSATPQGGGVAIMRHALIRLFILTGVDVSWYVMEDDPEAFKITKTKFHNVLQDVNADKSISLTDEDKKIFNDWSKKNAKRFKSVIKKSDVIVIDDPQPSGLVPYIKKYNPKAKVVYRSHIQLIAKLANKAGTPQNITWEFINNNIAGYDIFVSHPIPGFVPKEVPKKKLVYMGATTDPLDGLNKELSQKDQDYYMMMLNKLLIEEGQEPLDPARPIITQIARFDPSKGIPDVIDSYNLLCKKIKKSKKRTPLPQLVITGNSSVDDPDGIPIYDLAMKLKKSDDIKIIRLPHYDQLLNALLRRSTIALQLSYKEGYEFKITEALMKGIPTIIYNAGGMPLQIKNNVSGFIVEVGDVKKVASLMYDLLTDKELYMRMSDGARKNVTRDMLTVKNAIKWLSICDKLTN